MTRKRFSGVAANGLDAVAGADAGDDQRVAPQRGEHRVQVRVLERRGVAFADGLFCWLAIQSRIEFKEFCRIGWKLESQLLIVRAGRLGRIVCEGRKEDWHRRRASRIEHSASRQHDRR